MSIMTRARLGFNVIVFIILLGIQASAAYARDEECSFTVKPIAACEISFYKLLAIPHKYNNKYISVSGYMAIDNGRLAVFPNESSYSLGISQDSFTIMAPFGEREGLARDLNRKNVRIVGLFHHHVVGDQPGIGYISRVIDAHLIRPRSSAREDQYLSGTPEELLKHSKKANNQRR